MGYMEDGKWIAKDKPIRKNAAFKRTETQFQHTISSDPDNPFQPEKNRYELYAARPCPWAHRTLIMRQLKGLENIIPAYYAEPKLGNKGWLLEDKRPLHNFYSKADKRYSGRVTVPILWDTKQKTIVSNESADIIRIFNNSFNAFSTQAYDFYPEPLHQEIDNINLFIYRNINNGVYRCGFTKNQEDYKVNYDKLFYALDQIDGKLSVQQCIVGNQLTEADIRLFTTIVRFDPVYYLVFKCNKKMIRDYANIRRYLGQLLTIPAFRDTTNMDQIKTHYYNLKHINPNCFVPLGPQEMLTHGH